MDFKTLIRYDEALDLIDQFGIQPKGTLLNIEDSVGRIAFGNILSPSDFPPSNRSAVDGFAVKSEETISASRNNPLSLQMIGVVSANTIPDFRISRGQCARIFTGGTIPEGSDAVIMQEDTEIEKSTVYVFRQMRKFQNVMRTGEDLRSGDVIVRDGQRILPWHLAALIESGIKQISVHAESVGIISTGDELVSGMVANSTAPMLLHMFRREGIQSNFYGNTKDDASEILDLLNSINDDIVIVTGGSGPSSVDLMHDLIANNGKILFHGVRIKPGRTTGLGIYRDRPVFMISGLPVAALVSYESIIYPAVIKWLNIEKRRRNITRGILTRSVYNNDGVRMFVRVRIYNEDGKVYVDPLRTTGSGVISSVIDAEGYLIIPENLEGHRDGNEVDVQLIGD